MGFPTWRHKEIVIMYFGLRITLCEYQNIGKKVFEEPYREVLKKIIGKIGYDYNIEIVELEISEDHIHMVVRSEPKISPADTMQIVKSLTAREILSTIQKSRNNIFGVESYGHKVIL